MAVVNLSVTIPDPQVPRVLAAAKAAWGPAMTDAQIQEQLRQEVIQIIKGLVLRYERDIAVRAAEDALYTVDAT